VLDAQYKQDYIDSIGDFNHITNLAAKLSIETTGREVDSWRVAEASYIFGKICTHAISLLKLQLSLPGDNTGTIVDVWDISSIATITRSIIDSYYVCYYLAIDECSKSELEFRRELWNYHGEYQRFDMLKRIKSKNPKFKEIERDIDSQRLKIVNSSFYQTITGTKFKRNIIDGKVAVLLSNTELSKRAGINPDYYKSNFNYLSAYTHAHPYAFSQLKNFRVDDNESLRLVKYIIDLATGYICYAVRDFIKLVPDQKKSVDSKSKNLIDDWEDIFKNIIKPQEERS
jgi:Family of unknown function (DUF5677)